jgi:hypothetical protein
VRVLFAFGCLMREIVLSLHSKARGVLRTISSGQLSGGVEPSKRNKVEFPIEDAIATPVVVGGPYFGEHHGPGLLRSETH